MIWGFGGLAPLELVEDLRQDGVGDVVEEVDRDRVQHLVISLAPLEGSEHTRVRAGSGSMDSMDRQQAPAAAAAAAVAELLLLLLLLPVLQQAAGRAC